MTTSPAYLPELRSALGYYGVAPVETEQVVAEVQAHVADTGEDPVDVFGPPWVYAAQYAPSPPAPLPVAPPTASRTVPTWAGVVLGVIAITIGVGGSLVSLTLLGLAFSGGLTALDLFALLALTTLFVALPVVAHRARSPRSSWWTTAVVGLLALGLPGALLYVLLPVLLANAGSSQGCDGDGSCTDGPGTVLGMDPGVLVPGVLMLVWVLGWLAVIVRARRTRRR